MSHLREILVASVFVLAAPYVAAQVAPAPALGTTLQLKKPAATTQAPLVAPIAPSPVSRPAAAPAMPPAASSAVAPAAPQVQRLPPATQLAPAPAPAAASRLVPPGADPRAGALAAGVQTEEMVQAEIARLKRQRDAIVSATAKVGSNYSKVTYTPITGNSCIDPETTWNGRSGESFTCTGFTTCEGRSSRWSKSRVNPCEPGVVINSCVHSGECKAGTVCDTGKSLCVRP